MAVKQKRKIALMHELFGVCVDHKCGECVNFVQGRYMSKILRKCSVYGLTHSASSDWAKSWMACKMFGHEYNGRPVIELKTAKKEPDVPLENQIDLFGGDT